MRRALLASILVTSIGCAPSMRAPESAVATAASFEAELRALLAEMVAVDTSHGNETALLRPIAERYRAAGVPVQILESAPGRGNLVARLKGSGAKKPLLLLAHVDVVPVDGQPWTVPPFRLTEKDGYLYGRGVNDDKGMAATIVATTLEMARAKTPLTRDVIVALTAGEETGGFAGARWLAEHHRELLDAEIALNEGDGNTVTRDWQRVRAVGVSVSEKVFQSFRLVTRGPGGHSSIPPVDVDPVATLGRALANVGAFRFPARVLPEVRPGLATEIPIAKPELVEPLKRAVAGSPLSEEDIAALSTNAVYNAAMRTTCVATMLKAAPQDNALPITAEATINCRILPDETRDEVKGRLVAAIGDPRVEVSASPSFGDAPGSPIEGEVVDALRAATRAAYGDVPVVPSMSFGTTDSRYLRGIGIRAYGICGTTVTDDEAEEPHIAHGADERRPARWLDETARFFRAVVERLTR